MCGQQGLSLWIVLISLIGLDLIGSPQHETERMPFPVYDQEGSLLRPIDFEEWMFVGASLGLSYSEESELNKPDLFHNVYIQHEAYQHFLKTGEFPEKTMLAMSVYKPEQKVSINKKGFFEDKLLSLEVALKDHERFNEGWAYFDFGKSKEKATAFPKTRCFSCHNENGAHDNVFIQFYPLLRSLEN